MVKKFHKRQREEKKYYRVNERIFASTLRVLDSENKQIGVLSKFEALSKARGLGLDVVEIAPKATPPVAKIVDFKKFLYQQEKKKREEKKNAKVSEIKELRLGPFMSDNDLDFMTKRGREFLLANDKIRLVVKFKGRQITHPEFGREVMNKVIKNLSDLSKVERDPHFEGRQFVGIIVPDKKKNTKKEEPKKEESHEEKDKKISK